MISNTKGLGVCTKYAKYDQLESIKLKIEQLQFGRSDQTRAARAELDQICSPGLRPGSRSIARRAHLIQNDLQRRAIQFGYDVMSKRKTLNSKSAVLGLICFVMRDIICAKFGTRAARAHELLNWHVSSRRDVTKLQLHRTESFSKNL